MKGLQHWQSAKHSKEKARLYFGCFKRMVSPSAFPCTSASTVGTLKTSVTSDVGPSAEGLQDAAEFNDIISR
jgi:hypothetical protein